MWKQNYRCFCVWRSELINNFSNFTISGSILAHFRGSLACLHSECRTPDDTSGLYFLCGLIGIFAPIWFVDLSAIVGLLPGLLRLHPSFPVLTSEISVLLIYPRFGPTRLCLQLFCGYVTAICVVIRYCRPIRTDYRREPYLQGTDRSALSRLINE